MTPADEARFLTLWQQGRSHETMAQQLGIPVGTVKSRAHALQRQGKIQPRPRGGQRALATAVHPGTPSGGEGHTAAHPGTPARRHTRAHRSTPYLPTPHPTAGHPSTPDVHPTRVHRSTPAPQPTGVHQGVPIPDEAAVRLLALLPDLEVMVARERDRQRLLGTPISTPRHTVKKTYVVDTLYVDLIERYAQAEGVERKDVVNLAFHEFFERRQYLPEETP